MKKKLFIVILILAMVALATAPALAEKALKVAAASSCWKLDYAWGTSNYRATMMLRDLYGAKVTFIDTVPFADQERVLTDYAEAGNDVIIGWGYEFLDSIKKVAAKYPDKYFLLTCAPDAGTKGFPPNVASMYFMEEEGAYLCGILAASLTKTKKVAYVSGTDLPCVNSIDSGFRLGVYDTDPNVKTKVSYIGSWVDIAKEKALTNALIDAGYDVILSYAIGVGIADVVKQRSTKEHPIRFIGSQYLNEYKPDVVIATHYLNQMKALKRVYDDIVAGKFVGKPYKCTVSNGIIKINLFEKFIPSVIPYKVVDKVEKVEIALVQGDKVVSRLSNVGIRLMPETWPQKPVPNMTDYNQPEMKYTFKGFAGDPYYNYLRSPKDKVAQ